MPDLRQLYYPIGGVPGAVPIVGICLAGSNPAFWLFIDANEGLTANGLTGQRLW